MFGAVLILAVIMGLITIARFFMSIFSRERYFIFIFYGLIAGGLFYWARELKGAPLIWQDFPESVLAYFAAFVNAF